MLEEIDSLPGAKQQTPVLHRNRELGLGQRRSDMGGHVVRPFGRMTVERRVFGHQTAEESLQIPLHVGIGILLNRQGSGGVTAEKSEQPVPESTLLQPAGNLPCDICQTLARGRDRDGRLRLFHEIKLHRGDIICR